MWTDRQCVGRICDTFVGVGIMSYTQCSFMWDFDQDIRIFFVSLAGKNIFISSFPICDLFISFSCPITLARVSSMILKSVAGGTILALFMIFVGKLLIVFSLDDICRFFCKCSLSS